MLKFFAQLKRIRWCRHKRHNLSLDEIEHLLATEAEFLMLVVLKGYYRPHGGHDTVHVVLHKHNGFARRIRTLYHGTTQQLTRELSMEESRQIYSDLQEYRVWEQTSVHSQIRDGRLYELSFADGNRTHTISLLDPGNNQRPLVTYLLNLVPYA